MDRTSSNPAPRSFSIKQALLSANERLTAAQKASPRLDAATLMMFTLACIARIFTRIRNEFCSPKSRNVLIMRSRSGFVECPRNTSQDIRNSGEWISS